MTVIPKAGENGPCPGDDNRPPGPPAQRRAEQTITPDGHPKCGVTKLVNVKIPASLSRSGIPHWKQCPIDDCLAPVVKALQEGGVDMRGSCCGHGKQFGEIHLQDGCLLIVLSPTQARTYMVEQTQTKRLVLKLEEVE